MFTVARKDTGLRRAFVACETGSPDFREVSRAGIEADRIEAMSVTAVAAPPSATSHDASASPRPENRTPADEARARAEQPQPRAALPPGQGTRIDVLV